MIIVAGLIIIGILALIAAFFLVRDNKAKTGETSQQAMPKRVANKQVVTPTEPSASAKTESVLRPDSTVDKQPTIFAGPSTPIRTQESFPVPQVPFPTSTVKKQTVALSRADDTSTGRTFPTSIVNKQTVALSRADDTSTGRTFPTSAVNKQTVAIAEPLGPAKTQVSFPAPQVPFPTSTVNKQTVTLAEPSASTQTHILTKTPLLVQDAPITQTPVREIRPVQTPVHEIRPVQTPEQQAEADQIQAPVTPNQQQPTAKAFPETPMPLSIPSETVALPPSNTVSGPLSHSPSVDQQIAELIADTWALQQQAAEIGRRLNYLSTYIQHSPESESDGGDTDSKG
jgi:hypothetical protein